MKYTTQQKALLKRNSVLSFRPLPEKRQKLIQRYIDNHHCNNVVFQSKMNEEIYESKINVL